MSASLHGDPILKTTMKLIADDIVRTTNFSIIIRETANYKTSDENMWEINY